MEQIIENKKEELINLCKSLKIQRMNVFGSVVSGRFNKDSDIDLLISFSNDLSVDEYLDGKEFSLSIRIINCCAGVLNGK